MRPLAFVLLMWLSFGPLGYGLLVRASHVAERWPQAEALAARFGPTPAARCWRRRCCGGRWRRGRRRPTRASTASLRRNDAGLSLGPAAWVGAN